MPQLSLAEPQSLTHALPPFQPVVLGQIITGYGIFTHGLFRQRPSANRRSVVVTACILRPGFTCYRSDCIWEMWGRTLASLRHRHCHRHHDIFTQHNWMVLPGLGRWEELAASDSRLDSIGCSGQRDTVSCSRAQVLASFSCWNLGRGQMVSAISRVCSDKDCGQRVDLTADLSRLAMSRLWPMNRRELLWRGKQQGRIAEEVRGAGTGMWRGGTRQRRDVKNSVTGKEGGA
jgi:hypothetical protein